MANKTIIQKELNMLMDRQRTQQQQRTLIGPENTVNRITFDAEGRIVYGTDGLITLSAPKN